MDRIVTMVMNKITEDNRGTSNRGVNRDVEYKSPTSDASSSKEGVPKASVGTNEEKSALTIYKQRLNSLSRQQLKKLIDSHLQLLEKVSQKNIPTEKFHLVKTAIELAKLSAESGGSTGEIISLYAEGLDGLKEIGLITIIFAVVGCGLDFLTPNKFLLPLKLIAKARNLKYIVKLLDAIENAVDVTNSYSELLVLSKDYDRLIYPAGQL